MDDNSAEEFFGYEGTFDPFASINMDYDQGQYTGSMQGLGHGDAQASSTLPDSDLDVLSSLPCSPTNTRDTRVDNELPAVLSLRVVRCNRMTDEEDLCLPTIRVPCTAKFGPQLHAYCKMLGKKYLQQTSFAWVYRDPEAPHQPKGILLTWNMSPCDVRVANHPDVCIKDGDTIRMLDFRASEAVIAEGIWALQASGVATNTGQLPFELQAQENNILLGEMDCLRKENAELRRQIAVMRADAAVAHQMPGAW